MAKSTLQMCRHETKTKHTHKKKKKKKPNKQTNKQTYKPKTKYKNQSSKRQIINVLNMSWKFGTVESKRRAIQSEKQTPLDPQIYVLPERQRRHMEQNFETV